MSTSTLHPRLTPLAPVPVPAVVVRHDPESPRPYSAGAYVGPHHRWSPYLAFPTATEAMIYAAAVNRRTGRWSR